MIKRPSKNDSEKELLEMQQQFFNEQKKDTNFQPAAKVVKLEQQVSSASASAKESVFAQRRKLKNKSEVPAQVVVGMMGDIVERTFTPEQLKFAPDDPGSGESFPRVDKLDLSDAPSTKTGSLFAQMVAKKQKVATRDVPMYVESSPPPATGEDIHVENVARLAQMSNAEILAEQQRLMQSLDPSLIEFLKSRKSVPATKAETLERVTKTMEVEKESEKYVELEVLQEKGAENWLHFDVVEAEKLEWTKDIEEKKKNLKPGEQFEARFDWKGILLPFEDTTGISEDNRDLFLHGEEPNRPGYTLQELFRLARSNVLQQRITAITSIAGILNIYNQGFYDGILHLPLAKLFFFLRFALDENTPALVEVTAKALAFLFYNDTDETLSDVLYETAAGVKQPALEQQKLNASFVLDEAFGGMNLEAEEHVARSTAKPAYVSTLDDEELADKQAMTDFHMAETDLVEALLRTNILERIRYILFTMRAEEAVVVYLVKLLIRLARTNRDAALKIVALDGLIEPMVAEFLRPIESDDKYPPLYLVLKLFRVIGAYDVGMMVRLQNAGVLEAVEKYVFSRRDISMKMIQLQIEALRFLRLRFHYVQDDAQFSELLPALRYMLEWHYQYLKFTIDGPVVLRTHASAVIALLGAGKPEIALPLFAEILTMCLSKWFSAAARDGVHEFSQKTLIAVCLDTSIKFLQHRPTVFHKFIDNYLKPFMMDSAFGRVMAELSLTSPFRKSYSDRSTIHKPLPNMGAVVVHNIKSSPSLIYVKEYPTVLLASLLNFIVQLDNNNAANVQRHNELVPLFFNADLIAYVTSLANGSLNANVKTNWFAKLELKFLMGVMRWAPTIQHIEPSVLLKLAFKLLDCLGQDMINDLIYLFDHVVFNASYYRLLEVDVATFGKFRNIYAGYFVAPLIKAQSTGKTFVISDWQQVCLERCWPYGLLNILLSNFENLQEASTQQSDLPEDEIIQVTLQFTELLEANRIRLASPTEQLVYLMMAYLGPNTKFLEPDVKQLISRRVDALKANIGSGKFNLNIKIEDGKKSFESFYSLFLDQFQSSSYGDDLFSVLVMVPLAQKYDVKWRARVWSEFVAVVRFLTCQEDQVFGGIDAYLTPAEREESVVQSYALAMNSNLVRTGSLPHKIASHHVECFKATTGHKTGAP